MYQTDGINLSLPYLNIRERKSKLTLRARVLGDRQKLYDFSDFAVFARRRFAFFFYITFYTYLMRFDLKMPFLPLLLLISSQEMSCFELGKYYFRKSNF